MITAIKNIIDYRELIAALAWKNVTVRYKQTYLSIGWAILKPLTLMLVFMLVRSLVGIPSGNVPYPILAFAVLLVVTADQRLVRYPSTSTIRG